MPVLRLGAGLASDSVEGMTVTLENPAPSCNVC